MQKRKKFGEILVEAGVVSEDDLNRALDRQGRTKQRLGQVLEEMGVVNEKDIAVALARQFGFKTVANLARASFPADVLALVGPEAALSKLLFPLKKETNTLYLAMVNPLDIEVIDNLSFKTGMHITPCVTTSTEIHAAVNRHYYERSDDQIENKDSWWTILVVDDQELVRSAMAAALKRQGYRLLEADNGADAVKIAVQQKPHLILSDILMPRMDGYEMHRALKSNSQTRHIPLIAISAKSSAEEEARLLDMGYFDFIAKPINPLRLVARVKRALRVIHGDTPPPH